MERLIEEIPSFFTIWNIIFLAKAMGVQVGDVTKILQLVLVWAAC